MLLKAAALLVGVLFLLGFVQRIARRPGSPRDWRF